jgi:signal transduction histidine kinase
MSIRPKLFLSICAVALAALLLLCAINYWLATRSLAATLRDDLRWDANWIAMKINYALSERETGLVTLARSSEVRQYIKSQYPALSAQVKLDGPTNRLSPQREPSPSELPPELRASLTTFLMENRQRYESIAAINSSETPLFRATFASSAPVAAGASQVILQTKNLPHNSMGFDSIGGDGRFRSAREETPLRALSERRSVGPALRYTIPVFDSEGKSVIGALVANLRLDQVFKEQASDVIGALNGVPTGMQTSRVVIVLHQSGLIYYHPNAALSYQPVANAIPEFKMVADAMAAGETGVRFYDGADGDRRLASFRPLDQNELALAVVTDYSRELAAVRQELLRNLLAAVVIALLAALTLTLIAQRRSGKSLERLTQGAVAIARGRLDQQLVVSSAENQPLADSMNVITARLREQLAREAESRQFDSFLRLSAMLTHDLKNTITALSLGVSNMERNFERADFRADAMESLKEVTAKLQRLVSKLSEPVNTLSGEHQIPRAMDLVPLIKRVRGSLTSSTSQQHEIEVNLPEQLIAVVEPERMEKVIENLIINALEAMGEKKGKLTISGGSAGDKKVFFSISDTGPGMTRSFQDHRLFHPFATTKPTGVGLGLYTCREVVRAHGGSIEVTSEAGVGTTFRVVLPSVPPGE